MNQVSPERMRQASMRTAKIPTGPYVAHQNTGTTLVSSDPDASTTSLVPERAGREQANAPTMAVSSSNQHPGCKRNDVKHDRVLVHAR
jgi:hypothetical protein